VTVAVPSPRTPAATVKAALNMMTRTSGADYRKDNIYMTSVDTGMAVCDVHAVLCACCTCGVLCIAVCVGGEGGLTRCRCFGPFLTLFSASAPPPPTPCDTLYVCPCL